MRNLLLQINEYQLSKFIFLGLYLRKTWGVSITEACQELDVRE